MVSFIKKFLLLMALLFVVCTFVAGNLRVDEWDTGGKMFGCFGVLFITIMWQIMVAHDAWEKSNEYQPPRRTIKQKLRLIIGGKR